MLYIINRIFVLYLFYFQQKPVGGVAVLPPVDKKRSKSKEALNGEILIILIIFFTY